MIPTGSEARVTHEVENMAMLPTQRGVNEPHRSGTVAGGTNTPHPASGPTASPRAYPVKAGSSLSIS